MYMRIKTARPDVHSPQPGDSRWLTAARHIAGAALDGGGAKILPMREFYYHPKTIMTTQITQESFEAFLKCPTGAHGIEFEFGEW